MRIGGIAALVAGGASGLGEATARALVERGARVAIADLNEDNANELAAELGDAAVAVKADVTDEDEAQAAVTGGVKPLGGIPFTVNCAGAGWAARPVPSRGPPPPHP